MACLYLATKVEHVSIALDEFLAKIPNSPSANQMINYELLVSNAIGFQYMVHSPYLALHGSFLNMQVLAIDADIYSIVLSKIRMARTRETNPYHLQTSRNTLVICLYARPGILLFAE